MTSGFAIRARGLEGGRGRLSENSLAGRVEMAKKAARFPGAGQVFHRDIGVWRSLVARFVRDEEAVGSNPATPTILNGGPAPQMRGVCSIQHFSGWMCMQGYTGP